MMGGHDGAAPLRRAVDPPQQWPDPVPILQAEFDISKDEKAKQDDLVMRSREFVQRMRNSNLRLRIPEAEAEVLTYKDLLQSDARGSGISSLPQGLAQPLSHLYFPTELSDMLVPRRNRYGELVGAASNTSFMAEQFKHPSAMPHRDTLSKLAKMEEREKDGKKPERPRKNSTDSNTSNEEGDEIEDEEDDDYGMNYFDDGAGDVDDDDGGGSDGEAVM
jgi:DNA-directed RNA polymerase III subunit RPC7